MTIPRDPIDRPADRPMTTPAYDEGVGAARPTDVDERVAVEHLTEAADDRAEAAAIGRSFCSITQGCTDVDELF